MTDHQKAMVVGAECGLVFAAFVALICWLGKDGHETLQSLADVLGSVPTLLALRMGFRGVNSVVLCFIYWVIMGGVLGFLVGFRRPIPGMVAIAILVALLFFHELAQRRLAEEKEIATDTLGNTFSRGIMKR